MSLSNTLETEVQEAVFNGAALSVLPPSTLYLAAHTGGTGEDGGINEVSASDYSRLEVVHSSWDVTGNNPAQAENNIQFEFDTAQNNWGTIEELSLWDSLTGGNCLWVHGNITNTTISTNDRLIIEANAATFTLD